MAKADATTEALPTIWECPDELWDLVERVLAEHDPPAKTGRKRIDPRKALDGIIYQLRTGCQWNALPRAFGDDASVHRTMQRWVERGVMDRVWALLVERCEELAGIQWEWQSADAAMGKARLGGIASGRTPRTAGKTAPNAAC